MRSRRLQLSEQAANDLTAIYDYIAVDNPTAARHVIEIIETKIRSISALGITGVVRADVGSDLRMVVVHNFLIYFRVTPTHLVVIRILHGRQNISSKDFPESET